MEQLVRPQLGKAYFSIAENIFLLLAILLLLVIVQFQPSIIGQFCKAANSINS